MKRMRTDHIVLHCSATRPVQDIGAEEIRRWHRAKGWRDIGYHFVIRRDGTVEAGRAVDMVGSHVKGRNRNTLGICLIGGLNEETWRPEDNFTAAQWASLKRLLRDLMKTYPDATVLGHRDFPNVAKACPCFAAKTWASANGFHAAA